MVIKRARSDRRNFRPAHWVALDELKPEVQENILASLSRMTRQSAMRGMDYERAQGHALRALKLEVRTVNGREVMGQIQV